MAANSRADCLLPTGTVTLLFTDIEGSTLLWETQPEAMPGSLARHDALVRDAIVSANGYVFKTVGDAFCAAFAGAPDAVAAALIVQRRLEAEPWSPMTLIKVRMALHTGAVETRDGDYFGAALNRVARLLSTAHGGQTLLSQATFELSRDSLPDAVSLRDLGSHRLKDLARPEQVYQLQHPSLRGDFPPIKSLSTHPNNLPQQLTSFIGREKEIAEIEALLDRNRLLTVTGSGGSGKTRLTLQVAADSLVQFKDGAWLVELAPLVDPNLVAQTVATVLGVKEEPGKPIMQTLIERLNDKRLLLLLDNCEHLLDASALLADALVRQCPGVKILASSREALGIAGEQTYRVPSMSLPDRKQALTPQMLSQYESVKLFIDRALSVRLDFQVNNQNAPALASLCHQLDGIPLAIELAAARVRTLAVEEIDGKLDQRFRLLTGGSRTALPRHQTLRALIDWSYDLLHEPERVLLQRLSVFAGGWTVEAVEQVCAGNDVAAAEVLDLLTLLCDQSLVVAEQMDGHSRYRLLETVRQYARDRLVESGSAEAVRERHRDYFLALAEEAEPKLLGDEQAAWLRRLEAEHENLRAALDWSLRNAGSAEGLRLCGALPRFWLMRGHLSEAREWCLRVLERAGSEESTKERAKALNAAGVLAFYQGVYEAANALHQKSLMICTQLGDRRGIAVSLNNLGNVARDQGNFAGACSLHQEALTIRRELGDRHGIASGLNNLGNIAFALGDYSGARALYEESLQIKRELGDKAGIANTLGNLGNAVAALGDRASARIFSEQALSIRRGLGDQKGIAVSLEDLANFAGIEGDYASCIALHREGLVIRRELGERHKIAYSMEGLAEAVALLGSPLRAARMLGAAERLRAEIGSPLSTHEREGYDRCVATARAALGDDAAFDRAWQEGRVMTLERAIEFALEEAVARS